MEANSLGLGCPQDSLSGCGRGTMMAQDVQ